jgi:hypothetical protein
VAFGGAAPDAVRSITCPLTRSTSRPDRTIPSSDRHTQTLTRVQSRDALRCGVAQRRDRARRPRRRDPGRLSCAILDRPQMTEVASHAGAGPRRGRFGCELRNDPVSRTESWYPSCQPTAEPRPGLPCAGAPAGDGPEPPKAGMLLPYTKLAVYYVDCSVRKRSTERTRHCTAAYSVSRQRRPKAKERPRRRPVWRTGSSPAGRGRTGPGLYGAAELTT